MAIQTEPRERRFNYFGCNFTYTQVDQAITNAGFSATSPRPTKGGETLMGFAFFPVKTYSDLNTSVPKFETTGMSVALVSMGADGFAASSFKFYPVTISLNFGITDTIDLSSYLIGASAADTYNVLVNYNQSREFDLVFLNYETYSLFKSGFAGSGIAFCRAAVSMPIVTNPSASEYTNYRTLKFFPNPPPSAAELTPGGLDDVAYRLGEPCPPTWYEVNPGGSGGAQGLAPAPVMFSTDSLQQIGSNDDIPCGCAFNVSSIRKAMIEQDIIKNEVLKPLNVIRYILIRLIVRALVLVTVGVVATKVYYSLAG